MKNKENDDNNEKQKVSMITSKKRGISPIIDRKPGIAGVLAAAAFAGRKRNPKVTGTEQENLISNKKPGLSAAAFADTEQNPKLIDSLITGEKPSVDLKDLVIGKSAGGVAPVIEPKQVPGSTGGNSADNNIQTHKK